jgi:outer membrane protein TolC
MKATMKFFISIILFAAIMFTDPASIWGQDMVPSDPPTDYRGLTFAPLNVILDSAIARNPRVRFSNLGVVAKEANLKSSRSYWTRNLGLQTDIRSGTWDILSSNSGDGQNPYYFSSKSFQTNYGIGIFLKFPLYDLVNRKNQVNMATAELQQAESMAEAQKDELRQQVIKLYNDLLLKQSILRIKSKYLETAKINMQMVEKEFQNGVVPVSEYSRISEIAGRAESDFETARVDFINGYMILEEIVGFRFITNK